VRAYENVLGSIEREKIVVLPLHARDDVAQALPAVEPGAHGLDLRGRWLALCVEEREAKGGGEESAAAIKVRAHGSDSLDDVIRSQQQRRRDREAEGFGSLEVDGELEDDRLLDREIRWSRALQDLRNVHGRGADRH